MVQQSLTELCVATAVAVKLVEVALVAEVVGVALLDSLAEIRSAQAAVAPLCPAATAMPITTTPSSAAAPPRRPAPAAVDPLRWLRR